MVTSGHQAGFKASSRGIVPTGQQEVSRGVALYSSSQVTALTLETHAACTAASSTTRAPSSRMARLLSRPVCVHSRTCGASSAPSGTVITERDVVVERIDEIVDAWSAIELSRDPGGDGVGASAACGAVGWLRTHLPPLWLSALITTTGSRDSREHSSC